MKNIIDHSTGCKPVLFGLLSLSFESSMLLVSYSYCLVQFIMGLGRGAFCSRSEDGLSLSIVWLPVLRFWSVN